MGPGPRFEPESRDPQSRRITTYPTPANKCLFYVNENMSDLMMVVQMRGQGFEPW